MQKRTGYYNYYTNDCQNNHRNRKPRKQTNLMLRSWQPTTVYFLVGSMSMSYRVVFLTMWWVRVNSVPSSVCFEVFNYKFSKENWFKRYISKFSCVNCKNKNSNTYEWLNINILVIIINEHIRIYKIRK